MKRRWLAPLAALGVAAATLTPATINATRADAAPWYIQIVPGCWHFNIVKFVCEDEPPHTWGGFGPATSCNTDSIQPRHITLGVHPKEVHFYVSGCAQDDRWKAYFGETGTHASRTHPDTTFDPADFTNRWAGVQDIAWVNHVVGHNLETAGSFGGTQMTFWRASKFAVDASVRPYPHRTGPNAATVRIEADLLAASWGQYPAYRDYGGQEVWVYARKLSRTNYHLRGVLTTDVNGHAEGRVAIGYHGPVVVKLEFEGNGDVHHTRIAGHVRMP